MRGIRGYLSDFLPSWLSDAGPTLSVGYRMLWAFGLLVDAGIQAMLDGEAASRARGTPTALTYLGQERGIVRGQNESAEDYAERLRGWIPRVKEWGSAIAVARLLHEYLANHPRVRVITRSGIWVTMNEDGSVEYDAAPWDWDSISNPERAGNWWEVWVVVYPTQWDVSPAWGTPGLVWGADPKGLGHAVLQSDYTILASEIDRLKGAHVHVRCVIWTSDPSRFNPQDPASLPDGTWGTWGATVNGDRVPSGRDLTTCRYWELS